MKTLAQFKLENGVTSITLIKHSTGRQSVAIKDSTLILSKDCSLKEELFVIPYNKLNNGTDATDGVTVVPNTFVIINSKSTIGDTI